MSIRQLPLDTPYHNNQRLFSDHYLDNVLPGIPAWQMLVPQARAAMDRIAAVLAEFNPASNEAQTEHNLIRPVLAVLGHTFTVQSPLNTPHGTKKPDYVFYADKAALDANAGVVLDESRLGSAFAVGEAEAWDRALDVSTKAKSPDPLDSKAPSYQIAFYVQHSGVRWGILTNGRLWRLYHRDTAHKLDRYYEVDLPALVHGGNPGRFLYFYAFFRRTAFDSPDLGVDSILRRSVDYAHGVGESLKKQVYDALRHLAQGFLDYSPNGLSANAEMLSDIYDNSLILLYRVLFILFAEARELLPLRESPAYRDSYSLRAIAGDVADDLNAGKPVLSTTATLWPRLRTLFELIDRGSPALKIATFDGGLFDPKRHPFLERHAVGDARLREAIDGLARVDGQFVDYRDLAERHLGSIYEGLLEFHLAPTSDEGEWTVAIENDNGERKVTGSYYTPDYIVKYIVEQAVGPVLQQAVAGKRTDDEKIRAVLGVKVCDPAMGSGHFPVEVTEYIARFLVDLGVSPGGASGDPDLAYWKRRVAQTCVYGVDLNPLAVDLAKLSLWLATAAKDKPLSFLDHHLRGGDAIVGAWLSGLTTTKQSKGSTKAKKKAQDAIAAGQISMLEGDEFRHTMGLAVGSMWIIEEKAGNTIDDVREQERVYQDLRDELNRKYQRVANLATSAQFGVSVDPAAWPSLVDYASGRTPIALPAFKATVDESEALAERRRFFHWELEFPEVFFDRRGEPLGDRAGFDAVVGNPPYVRQELLSPLKPFLQIHYASFNSVADLYVYFYERGLRLLREDGRLAYISSGTFARANFAKPFRAFLPTVAHLETIVDFGENQPFDEAEMVRPSIVVAGKGQKDEAFRSLFISGKIPISLEQAVARDGIDCDSASLIQPEWTFQPAPVTRLLTKLLDLGRPLIDAVDGKMFYGVKTGLNESFVIDGSVRSRLVEADPKSAEIIHRLIQGQDLRPWYHEDVDRWLIVIPSGYSTSSFGPADSEVQAWQRFAKACPAVAGHLRLFENAARVRLDKGEYWWELRPCDYYAEFSKPKIFWPDIAKLPRFSWWDAELFIGNTGYVVTGARHSLLGILQSRVLWFAASQICQPLRLRAGLWQYRLIPQFVGRLPIPDLSDGDETALGECAMAITARAQARYALDEKARHRVLSGLGKPGASMNQKLTAWWTLAFPSFCDEVRKSFKVEIPLKKKDEWEEWLTEQRAVHHRLTDEIVRLETTLNQIVYGLFDLTPDEIKIVEETTKYRYGEV